jgi:hypothetical protein
MLALRDFGDLLCVSHPKPFDSVLYDGSNRNSFEAKIGAYNYGTLQSLKGFIPFPIISIFGNHQGISLMVSTNKN